MRKAIDPVGLNAPVARRSPLGLAAAGIALVLLLPIALDLAGLVVGQWRAMLGSVVVVETPALDFVRETAGEVKREVWRVATIGLGTIGGRLEYLIAALVVCVAVGAFVLRRAP